MSNIRTPPTTSLSPPASPTEQLFQTPDPESTPQDESSNMTPATAGRPIYLIVATSVNPPMGIGLKNSLPWTQLKPDMAFFKRVTTDTKSTPSAASTAPSTSSPRKSTKVLNAVIMGRKTWDSIPPRFRPLVGRVNVVVSREVPEKLAEGIVAEWKAKPLPKKAAESASQATASTAGGGRQYYAHSITQDGNEGSYGGEKSGRVVYISTSPDFQVESSTTPVIATTSVPSALAILNQHYDSSSLSSSPSTVPSSQLPLKIGTIFVIGGRQIYSAAIDHLTQPPSPSSSSSTTSPLRILQTQVQRPDHSAIECDTFFPLTLGSTDSPSQSATWQPVNASSTIAWIGMSPLHQQGEGQALDGDEWCLDADAGLELRVMGWECRYR